jgi:threonine/homoserine/homoserine lactone efflux protein
VLEGPYIAFLVVALLLTITPGADMALVTRHALVNGPRAALQAMLGVITGLIVWATLSAVGLAALLNASATAFTALKLIGSAYLIWLGALTLWKTRQQPQVSSEPSVIKTGQISGILAYRQGLVSNLLNPKIGVFYTTFLPQFVTGEHHVPFQLALLSLTHILMGLAWLTCYVHIVTKVGTWLRRPRTRLWLDRATGMVLIALGLRLAGERR